jgi:threonine synthase
LGVIKGLYCPRCARVSPSRAQFRCAACDSVLEVKVEMGGFNREHFEALRGIRDRSIWRWFDFFPVERRSSIVSLGEGDTPLVHAHRLGAYLDIPNLHLKNDTVLPTGSLKDRSNSVGISAARELGFDTVSVMSTGNAAASVAAYAAAAGMKSVVMVPAGTAPAKIAQARAYGAAVIVVRGGFDAELALLYRAAIQEFGWYDCLSSNPYRSGKKSYAYEFVDQLDGRCTDWVIHPTAGGAGILYMWQGFKELAALGCIERPPRLVAAQSARAAPIVAAFERGMEEVEPVSAAPTAAESIQVGNPSALGWRALAALRQSGGSAVALTEREIHEGQFLTARYTGVFAEPAGAISVAAAKKLRQTGVIGRDEVVICNITGHGLKQPEAVRAADEELTAIAPTLEALRERIALENPPLTV